MIATALIFMMASQAQEPALIPTPARLEIKSGSFNLSESTRVLIDPQAINLKTAVAELLGRALRARKSSRNKLHLSIEKDRTSMGEEGYHLSVKPSEITIQSATSKGLFYGLQTLRQLLPASIYGGAQASVWAIPCVEIDDWPRFPWRGLMIDSSRHFMPKSEILKFVDLLAMHKMNVLHLHLVDDQGWRIEIKRYPKLTEIGSKRDFDSQGHFGDELYGGKKHGGFYTQQDIRDIVRYARERYITVVPEIEMPGHSQAAIDAYNELGTGDRPGVTDEWGSHGNVYNVNESTIKFLQNVLKEVMQLFPSKFIHIGGDEVSHDQWQLSPSAQALKKERGLKDEQELQSWFIRQMDAFLADHGRRLIGWDEILMGGLAPGATVMSWRGIDGGIAAAKAGHDVVMAPTSHTYFDYYQSKFRAKEPPAGGGYLPLETVYQFDPVPSVLSDAEAKHILGGQCQLWAEYIPTPSHLEYMAFPRAAALAEVVWSPKKSLDFADFRARLVQHLKRLDVLEVNYRRLDPPMPAPIGHWSPAEVSEQLQTKEWEATPALHGAGTYDVLFEYTVGECRLDIAWVELLEDGKTIARDAHDGRTGAQDMKNQYRLTLADQKPGSTYLVRAGVRSDGGTDSSGDVYFIRSP